MKPHVEVANGYLFYFSEDAVCSPDTPLENSHLHWMLLEIIGTEMSDTKANRWLGFVQGIMTSKGYLDVQDERNRTREIFKGA